MGDLDAEGEGSCCDDFDVEDPGLWVDWFDLLVCYEDYFRDLGAVEIPLAVAFGCGIRVDAD